LFIADSGVLVNRTNGQLRKTFEPSRLKASPDHAAVHAMGRAVGGRGQRTAKVNHQVGHFFGEVELCSAVTCRRTPKFWLAGTLAPPKLRR